MCHHEKFMQSLGVPQTNREYWIMTEIFVYLHNGKDYCDCQKAAYNSDDIDENRKLRDKIRELSKMLNLGVVNESIL